MWNSVTYGVAKQGAQQGFGETRVAVGVKEKCIEHVSPDGEGAAINHSFRKVLHLFQAKEQSKLMWPARLDGQTNPLSLLELYWRGARDLQNCSGGRPVGGEKSEVKIWTRRAACLFLHAAQPEIFVFIA